MSHIYKSICEAMESVIILVSLQKVARTARSCKCMVQLESTECWYHNYVKATGIYKNPEFELTLLSLNDLFTQKRKALLQPEPDLEEFRRESLQRALDETRGRQNNL